MDIGNEQNDTNILAEVGVRLERRRLDLGLTQARLATNSGVSKRTVERVENGQSAQFLSFIKILRALEMLSLLDMVIPAPLEPKSSFPQARKKRQRASAKSEQIDLIRFQELVE